MIARKVMMKNEYLPYIELCKDTEYLKKAKDICKTLRSVKVKCRLGLTKEMKPTLLTERVYLGCRSNCNGMVEGVTRLDVLDAFVSEL